MSENDNPAVLELLNTVCQRFESAELFYGHGTDNAWDEAVFLVLHCMGLPLDSSEEVLEYKVSSEALAKVQVLVERRITDRVPRPYLPGVAWFACIEFYSDKRAIIPRSPIYELI